MPTPAPASTQDTTSEVWSPDEAEAEPAVVDAPETAESEEAPPPAARPSGTWTGQRPLFSVVRLREAYDAQQVDEMVDQIMIATAMTTPQLTADDVDNAQFTQYRLRAGYSTVEVDDWLDLAAAELTRIHAGGDPITPEGA